MGEIRIPGSLSGQTYSFQIAGDQPNPEELQQMQSIMQRDEQAYAQQFEKDFGVGIAYEEDPGTAIGRGWQRGVPQFQSALGSALGGIGWDAGEEYLENAATERQLELLREDPALLEGSDWRDVRGLGSAATYFGELLGEQGPIIGGTVGATGAGALAGAALPVAAGIATVAVSYPQLFGSNIQRQEAQVREGALDDVDIGRAASYAVGQTALEAASNAFLAGRIPTGVIKSMLANAPAEAVTEVGQQALERMQAGLDTDSEDAYKEYLDAGIAGGALGAGFGAVGGLRSGETGNLPPGAETPRNTPQRELPDDELPSMPDPRIPVSQETFSELGIPGAVPESKRFAAGEFDTNDAALDALEAYANKADQSENTKPLADRVRSYVAAAREYQLTRIDPELEAQQDADTGTGEGIAGIGEPGPVDTPGGTAAPDIAGLETAPERAGDVETSTGAQPDALSEADAFEAAAQEMPSRGSNLPPNEAATREEQSAAPPAPDARNVASATVDEYLKANPGVRASKQDVDAIIDRLLETDETVDVAAGDVLSLAASQEQAKTAQSDENVDDIPFPEPNQVPALEIESRVAEVAEPAAEPTAEPTAEPDVAEGETLTTAEMERNTVPGRPGGAPVQLIPQGVRPVASREPELVPGTAGETEINAAVNNARARAAQQRRGEDDVATREIARRYTERATPELQTFAKEEVPLDPSRDVTSLEDKQKVIALLDKKFSRSEEKMSNPEWAAFQYFRKHADVLTSIDTIAYDAIAAASPVTKTSKDMSAGAREYYRQTGRAWGTSAGKWVLDNMSRDTRLQFHEQLDFYRPRANDAVQRASVDSREDKSAVQRDRDYRKWLGTYTGDFTGTEFDADTSQELGLDTESIPDVSMLFSKLAALDMPLHPQVERAVANSDVNGVLDGIIATAGSPEASLLAQKLRPYVQGTPIRRIDSENMVNVMTMYGQPEVVVEEAPAGLYLSRYSDQELRQTNRLDESPERAELRSVLNGSVLINIDKGMDVSTVLHELMHVATVKTLMNESHPLTRQIETMLKKARGIIPAHTYGLENRYEFVAEGLTNPDFIQELSKIDTGLGDQKFTLSQRFTHALRNFFRQLLGRKAKPLKIEALNQKDALDEMLDGLLATDKNMRGVGTLYEKTHAKNGYRDALNSMKDNVIEATPQNMGDLRRLASSSFKALPFAEQVKDFTVRAGMPLMFVAESAQKMGMPSAWEVYKTVMEHGGQQHRMSQRVDETLLPIKDWLKKNPNKVDDFNQVRFEATEYRVDPRKPRSEYTGFTRGDEDAELRLQKYDEVKARYRQLGEEGRGALNRALELPEYFREEMKRVVRVRLQTMFPGKRATQERIYKDVFEKIFADTLIDPYQALQRRGNFGLSYSGRDPVTGEVRVFKHAFESSRQRDMAIAKLEGLDSNVTEIRDIESYSMDSGQFSGKRPSMEFISEALNRIEDKGGLASEQLRNEFLNLVFESTPETSFFNAYRQRKGTPGYEGDMTPLDMGLSVGDTMNNIRRNGMHLAAKVSDTEYQVKLDKLRKNMDEEARRAQQQINTDNPPDKAAAKIEALKVYEGVMQDFTYAPFRARANWARSLTAAGYAMTLGFNVSTAAITFFQFPTIIFPYFAAKFGGRRTMQASGFATRLLTSTGKQRTVERVSEAGGLEAVRRKVGWYDFSISNLDFGDPKNAYMRDLHDVADLAGIFNRSLTQDILDETGAKGWVQKGAAYSGLMQHHAERYMRESSLLSSYMMELHNRIPAAKSKSFDQFVKDLQSGKIEVPTDIGQDAAREAVYLSDMTNGSMLAAAAPALSQTNLGSVMYLFKRFPLAMLNMVWHTAKRAADANNDPLDRRVAALQFGGVAGSLGLFSGVAGLPGFQIVASLWDLIKDDEDEDLETLIRTGALGEQGLTGLVDYYAGISVSSRIGLSGAFYRPGFNTEDQPTTARLLEGFGGPVVGLFTKYADRVPYFFGEGEYWRMTEALLPTSMGNAMKSMRFYNEGARTLRHDPMIDDIGPFSAGAQFFGFMPTEYGRQLAFNNQARRIDNAISEKRTKLLRQRYIAIRMGDMDRAREIMQDIVEFNRRNPQAVIDGDTMDDSLRSHIDTTSRMHHGITYSRKNEGLLTRLYNDFGKATVWSD